MNFLLDNNLFRDKLLSNEWRKNEMIEDFDNGDFENEYWIIGQTIKLPDMEEITDGMENDYRVSD